MSNKIIKKGTNCVTYWVGTRPEITICLPIPMPTVEQDVGNRLVKSTADQPLHFLLHFLFLECSLVLYNLRTIF